MKSAWLSRIEVNEFGPFENKTFSFKKGLNLILGRNGSGKTCLASMVPIALLGTRGFRSGDLPPFGSGRIAVTIDHSEGRARIVRDLSSDRVQVDLFAGNGAPRGRIETKAPGPGASGQEDSAQEDYLRWLAGVFRLKDRECLAPGFSDFWNDVNPPDRPFAAFLHTVCGVMNRDALPGFRQIASPQPPGGRQGPENPGAKELVGIRNRLKVLEGEWFAVKNRIDEFTGDASDPDREKQNEKSFPGRPNPPDETRQGDGCSTGSGSASPEQSTSSVNASSSGARQGDSETDELLKARKGILEQISRTGVPFDPPKELKTILEDAAALRKELIETQNQARDIRASLDSGKGSDTSIGMVLTLVLCTAAAAGCWIRPQFSLYFLLVAGGLLAGTWTILGRRLAARRSQRFNLRSRKDDLDRKLEKIKTRQDNLEPRFLHLGLSPSAVEMVKMEKNLPRHLELREQLKDVDAKLRERGILPENTDDDQDVGSGAVASDPGETTRAEAAGEEGKPDFVDLGDQPDEVQVEILEKRLQDIEVEGEELHRRESRLKRESADFSALRESMIHWSPFSRFFETHDSRDSLQEELSGLLKAVSHDRFVSARLDENLVLEVRARNGEWFAMDRMSKGLSAMVGLALTLTGARSSKEREFPWLVFDDALECLDSKMEDTALGLLEKAYRDRQVILTSRDLSLKNKSRSGRWYVIDLDEPESTVSEERKDEDVGQLHLL